MHGIVSSFSAASGVHGIKETRQDANFMLFDRLPCKLRAPVELISKRSCHVRCLCRLTFGGKYRLNKCSKMTMYFALVERLL